jgi:macrodomain Ter protein organizer (MatP/YcbG family)
MAHKKTQSIGVRLAPAERQKIEGLAEKFGLNLSETVRAIINDNDKANKNNGAESNI